MEKHSPFHAPSIPHAVPVGSCQFTLVSACLLMLICEELDTEMLLEKNIGAINLLL
jgi:hypothetical protein